VVTNPDGSTFDPPLDVTTNIGFAAYCSSELHDHLGPIVLDVLRGEGLI